ncbi:DNA polymerase IV [uncultured Ruminococcus sp.]|uniref:DNA polymerase IV n=1 Tax=Massiliimalia timonensis TaxID=1987501 RepID=A0A8J6PD65_9FIRM|nr:DNA polymerase IV [Massiliimalia timonensis]MBC8609962.1 DNA polymerase IV [Massiliimalia timonensis]SCH16947.1 DNA polymerase IV [uncultured Ruminococcus sp.]SCH23477.1 DNA polymerase IV [uncultured Clostridium sp.]
MDRTILHCDCNGFYASVECVHNPKLKEVPMAVCGSPDNRHGIILAKNELAKRQGVLTAETIWQAKQKCPDLTLVPPHREEYLRYSKLVNQIYLEYTDLVEPFGIDESWLDVTGSRRLFGDGRTIANTLRERIRRETGLTISVGVSFNKIFAKLGSDYKKPDATTVISRENFQQLLYPLPVDQLLYVGNAVNKTLKKFSIRTIGDLAGCNKAQLSGVLGKLGENIWEYANGLDSSPVRRFDDQPEVKSIGNHITFRRNLTGTEDFKVGILALADSVAMRLRKHGLKCRGVQIIIKDPQLKSISRQTQLENPTDLAKELGQQALSLLSSCWSPEKPIRMLGLTAIQLTEEDCGFQISLFAPQQASDHQKQQELEQTIDKIRQKYGVNSVQQAVILKNDIGVDRSSKSNYSRKE